MNEQLIFDPNEYTTEELFNIVLGKLEATNELFNHDACTSDLWRELR